ncbi:hypothetical protein [Pseudomonas huanghezhanensis]|uniref:hypothetical protein n=1 Tax=Pseudomonas huanghezhanensis TaxID=3002903 RepID=UPI0022859937|nr:hypothetical protein [Pseudomonas sp. BSw22131]
MPKFITDLHLETFLRNAEPSTDSTASVTSAIALALSVVSGLLLLAGAFSSSVTSLAIGVLGLVAAQAIKTRVQ